LAVHGLEDSYDVGVFAQLDIEHRAIHNARRQDVLGDARDGAPVAADALADIYGHGPAAPLGGLFQGAL